MNNKTEDRGGKENMKKKSEMKYVQGNLHGWQNDQRKKKV